MSRNYFSRVQLQGQVSLLPNLNQGILHDQSLDLMGPCQALQGLAIAYA